MGAFTWENLERNGSLYMMKEPRLSRGGFDTVAWIWWFDDASHNWLIWWHVAWIGWYDDISDELVYMMTHRMNWLIWWHSMNCLMWWHIAWIGWYDDTSHELFDMMTHRMNWFIWWRIAWIGWYDDTSHELVYMMTQPMNWLMWYIGSIWRYVDISYEYGDVMTHDINLVMCGSLTIHAVCLSFLLTCTKCSTQEQIKYLHLSVLDESPAFPRLHRIFCNPQFR